MGNPDACDSTERLALAFRRYEQAYRDVRPGTSSAAALARARLDLTLLLVATGEVLPEEIAAQTSLDAESLVRTTPALEGDLKDETGNSHGPA
jgi:hypothetical protein